MAYSKTKTPLKLAHFWQDQIVVTVNDNFPPPQEIGGELEKLSYY